MGEAGLDRNDALAVFEYVKDHYEIHGSFPTDVGLYRLEGHDEVAQELNYDEYWSLLDQYGLSIEQHNVKAGPIM